MPNYQDGKIYIITGSETDKVYLGSTVQALDKRLWRHREGECGSSIIIDNNKENNIVLLETYPCNSKEELRWRERYWYDELKNILVNKNIPICSKEEQRVEHNRKQNKKREDENSWGGDKRYYNNLLLISVGLFD